MLPNEQKQFQLRPARKPETIAGLHNTVLVYHAERGLVEYGYVQFDVSLAVAAGKVLPQGVSAFDPAFLQVHFDTQEKRWTVSVCYVFKEVRRALWVTTEFPVWLKTLKKVGEQNGTSSKAHRTACVAA